MRFDCRIAFRFTSLILSVVAGAAAPAFGKISQERPALRVPPVEEERSPSEKLELAIGNLFELLAHPDPRYQPFVHFTERTRLFFVVTQPGGLAETKMFEGEPARRSLTAMFGPKPDISFSFGQPEVDVDGAFGRARLRIMVKGGAKSPDCGFAYVDAVLAPPGKWARAATQGQWQFTQVTVSFEKISLKPCPS